MPNTTFIHGSSSAERVDRGDYLGCTLDFWVVLAANVIGVPLCFAVVHACVTFVTRSKEGSADDSDESDEEAKAELIGMQSVPAPKKSVIQRALGTVFRNESATFNMDLALRGAIVALFCAMTYQFPWLSWWQSYGWSMSYVVVMLAFTLYKDVGSTVQLAWSGYYGTMLSVVNCYIMFTIFPDGGGSGSAWWFGVADLVVIVWVVIAGNFHTNAKMFFLSWQAYFSMCFLNPSNDAIFSHSILRLTLDGEDTSAMMGTIWGCIFAILCTLIPNDVSALRQAQTTVLSIAWEQGAIWQRLLAHCSEGPGTLERELLRSEMRTLRETVGQLPGQLTNSWWECFDLGRSGALRARMCKVKPALVKLQGWLEAAWFALEKSDSPSVNGAGSQEVQLLKSVSAEMSQLQQVSSGLLHVVARVSTACEEDLSSEQEEELQRLMAAQEEAQARLAAAVVSKRAQLLGGAQLTKETIPGQGFAYALSAWSQTLAVEASELSEDGGGIENADMHGPVKAFFEGLVDVYVPYKDCTMKYILHTLKLVFTFFCVFMLGRYGLWARARWVIPNYNATPPGTVAYLIFSGNEAAALKKNSDRLLGVSIGILLGQMLFVGLCDAAQEYASYHIGPLVKILGLTAFFFVELRALFVYFNSPTYAYTGLLVAAFFAEHILSSCGALDANTQDRANYQNLLGQFAAILLATMADVLTDSSQSLQVADLLVSFSGAYKKSLRDLAPPADGEGLLAAQQAAGEAAAHEPRSLKPPWREALWTKIHGGCCELLRLSTVLAFATNPNGASPMAISPTMQSLLLTLCKRLERTLEFTSDLLRHDIAGEEPPDAESLRTILSTHTGPMRGLKDALGEVNASLANEPVKPPPTLISDGCSAMAVAFAVIEATNVCVEDMELAIMDEPDLRDVALA